MRNCEPQTNAAGEAWQEAEHEAHEKAVYDVALWLMAREGEDEGDPHELLYSGGPILEPWGERWQKWEDDARQVVALVKPNDQNQGRRQASPGLPG